MAATPTSGITLHGFALHAGTATAVTLSVHDGPITLARGDHRASLDALRVARTDWGVAVTDDRGLEIDLVEHLFAAFGGLGIRRGILATVEGPELPILDGGARSFAEALARFELAPLPPELVVVRAGRLESGDSAYDFEPGGTVDLVVETIFDHPAIGTQRARWVGDARSFRERIAPARTFGFAGQAVELARRGRAGLALATKAGDRTDLLSALRRAVVVLDDVDQAPRFEENEVARHKLLDLIGDLAFYGGPPVGRVVARRPGHTATHRIVQQGLTSGILSRR